MEIYNDHRKLFVLALLFFFALTLSVSIFPAFDASRSNAPLPGSHKPNASEYRGKAIFIREGCVACHTQQVRNIEMDKFWGSRPGVAADYANIVRTDIWRNTATLMGSERTGPDLSNIGSRQPAAEWHLLHLYNPRLVVPESVMPSYEWLFEKKDYAFPEDVIVNIPKTNDISPAKIVATREALDLINYLKTLKQAVLPDGTPRPEFLYSKIQKSIPGKILSGPPKPDGEGLYAANCQSCHQENGKGLPGAFPPLAGSPIVGKDDPEVHILIVMQGFNGRVSEGYGIMPPVGTNNLLTAEQVTAIVNYERSNWGNHAKQVSEADVKKILNKIKK